MTVGEIVLISFILVWGVFFLSLLVKVFFDLLEFFGVEIK